MCPLSVHLTFRVAVHLIVTACPILILHLLRQVCVCVHETKHFLLYIRCALATVSENCSPLLFNAFHQRSFNLRQTLPHTVDSWIPCSANNCCLLIAPVSWCLLLLLLPAIIYSSVGVFVDDMLCSVIPFNVVTTCALFAPK